MDAILVGIATVQSDDPLLTARPAGPRCPARVVLDSAASSAGLEPAGQTARDAPVIVATTERATPHDREQLSQARVRGDRIARDAVAYPSSRYSTSSAGAA